MLHRREFCQKTIAKTPFLWYTVMAMKYTNHFYVSRKFALTWLSALCLVGSAVTRLLYPDVPWNTGGWEVLRQILLPVGATLLYVLILLLGGKEFFYRTAIPVWLLGIYFAFRPHTILGSSTVYLSALYVVVLVYCLLYTAATSGKLPAPRTLLLILDFVPLGSVIYVFKRTGVASPQIIADYLLFFAGILIPFVMRLHPEREYHPTWGDRVDGRRIRSLPAMSQVSPYIMVNRNEASNLFETSLEITHVDRYIRQKRREGLTNFGITHVLLACYLRAMCKYPGINRFLSGQKVYSRGDDVQYCMTVKKEMSADAPDTVIKVHLSMHDTAESVYKKLQAAVEEVKNTPLDSSFDDTARLLTLIPGVFLKFVVWLLRTLDYFGLLPKFLLEVSPFHGSLFFTSMGSLGIPPVYHHLYDFGNMPVFGAFGCKRRTTEILEDGTVISRKYVDVKFTLDERIVDGYYYAAFFKHYMRLLRHPELLDQPPKEVLSDIP